MIWSLKTEQTGRLFKLYNIRGCVYYKFCEICPLTGQNRSNLAAATILLSIIQGVKPEEMIWFK